jgi:hypothetical protein
MPSNLSSGPESFHRLEHARTTYDDAGDTEPTIRASLRTHQVSSARGLSELAVRLELT